MGLRCSSGHQACGRIFVALTFSRLVVAAAKCPATAREVLNGTDLESKTFVITGGSSGIGYETALALASAGASIVLGSRGTTTNAVDDIRRKANSSKVSFIPLDLSMLSSVRSFAVEVSSKLQGINGLICNAGILYNAVDEPRTSDGLDRTLEVNFLGHALLVQELLPLLRSSNGRVVHISSDASFRPCSWGNMKEACRDMEELPATIKRAFKGSNGYHVPSSLYGLSKYLQVFHAAEIARREESVMAFSVNPGIVSTRMTQYLPSETLRKWCKDVSGPCPLNASQGAITPIYAATVSRHELHPLNGGYLFDCSEAPSVRSQMVHRVGLAETEEYQRRLYDFAVSVTASPADGSVDDLDHDREDDGHPFVRKFLLSASVGTVVASAAVIAWYLYSWHQAYSKRVAICREVEMEVQAQLSDSDYAAMPNTPRTVRHQPLNF